MLRRARRSPLLRPRIEIPLWRYSPGTSHAVDPDEDAGFRQDFHRPAFVDTDWQSIECFTSIGERSDPVQPGYGWFRTTFELPGEAQGQPIGIAVGGYDNEDWQYYRVFVNGEEVGARELSGRWREPTPFVLEPDHPAYRALQFGGKNLLAVQAGRMNKLTPEMDPAESVRYFFRSRLVDQFVTVGIPTTESSDFRLKEYWPAIYGLPPANPTAKTEAGYYPLRHWASGGDRDWMWCMFWAEDEAANVQVIYHFQIRSGEPLIPQESRGEEPWRRAQATARYRRRGFSNRRHHNRRRPRLPGPSRRSSILCSGAPRRRKSGTRRRRPASPLPRPDPRLRARNDEQGVSPGRY